MSAITTNGNGNGEVIEGSAVEIYQAPPPSGLFGTDDPVEIVVRASKVAQALKSVIVQQRLFKNINGRDHVLVEGWTTLGSMLGVVPIVQWSRRIEPATKYDVEVIHYEWVTENGRKLKREKGRSSYTVDGYDWEARVEARTMDGRTVGGAEAMCSRKEHTWSRRDDYALRSMAQTRATSKALRGPLGFIVSLAGYAATPAEEMPADDGGPGPAQGVQSQSAGQPTARPAAKSERPATEAQQTMLRTKAAAANLSDGAFANVLKAAGDMPPVEWSDEDAAKRWLERNIERLPARCVTAAVAGIAAAAEGSQA